MPSKDVLQPNLRSPEDQRFRMAGTASTEAPSKTRIAAKVVTGLMGVLATEQFVSTQAVQAQDGEEATPEPTQTATPEPQGTPTPGETAVAMVSLDRNRFVEVSRLESFPQTIRYVNPFTQQEVQVTVDPAHLSQIMATNGTPLPLGVYDEQHPIPIDPRAFGNFSEYSLGDLRPAYIVGVLTEVNRENDTNPYIAVALPLPASRDYFPVTIPMVGVAGRYCAIDETGNLVPPPANLLDDYGRIPYGQEGITYSNEENWIAFPTSQGTSVIRVGDPIIVRVVFNLDVYNPGYRQGFIVSSSGRTPEQVIADLYDNDPSNDGQWYTESFAAASAFQPRE